jgi:hypothetical protein
MPILETGQEVSFGDYLVSLEANNHAIIRHKVTDEDVQPSFYEMQIMKCIAFGGDAAAIEIFPKQRDLFDGQNQRHLWKMDVNEFPVNTYQRREN